MKYKGDLEGFPQEVVEWMLDQQEAQGNKRDVSVFEEDCYMSKSNGGFDWDQTKEGYDFCIKVISEKNFEHFLTKYPKKNEYPMLMWVGDSQESVDLKRKKRVVFAEKKGFYISWHNAESFEEAEEHIFTTHWKFAEPVKEPIKIKRSNILEIFGCDDFEIVD